jgi:pyruvate/2-oxoglutarate/acetoin dehydrogenase E1 component
VTLTNYALGARPDVTIFAYGGMSRLLVPVLERLHDEEIHLLACLPSCISPLDPEPLVAAAAQSERVLIVEESQVAFGWGAEVAVQLYARLGSRLQAPIVRLGAAPTVIPAGKALEDQVLVTEAALETAIVGLLMSDEQ